ncbi:16S rRNA (cytidine(1402)-2'-O)-methyltransferase [Corynebacterium lactis]|uniref:Ribosomal RNA small subunit methyltransferase I n=1 Tax=Corynebacterium lactis RW2-5 TaxID=1408189 RepID=A0A0K2H1H8_9CORY|nr:16S rRNA (cytidine(1402)-2'-O)-methyltransferase [Corynebacterium lactis]ALA67884.1 16S rRNA methyltransferase [Corynebacterium lactis RW2-5]
MTHSEPLADTHTLPAGINLVATPLGNIADASDRLRQALADADIIAAEDTRRARNLASALGIEPRGKFVSNFDHNEDSRTSALIAAAKSGKKVIVVTDAGMPVVSDPGLAVVAAAHDAEVPVTCIPGASAVTTALALSGLGVGHFCFDGFAPRKSGARRAWLESLVAEKRACCFFESPHRLATTLADAAEILGPQRRASVSRELTKRFEETKRATLGELAEWAADGVRGEITVVIEGAGETMREVSTEDLVERVEELAAAGDRLKDACKKVAAEAGLSKHRDLYQAVLAAREENR